MGFDTAARRGCSCLTIMGDGHDRPMMNCGCIGSTGPDGRRVRTESETECLEKLVDSLTERPGNQLDGYRNATDVGDQACFRGPRHCAGGNVRDRSCVRRPVLASALGSEWRATIRPSAIVRPYGKPRTPPGQGRRHEVREGRPHGRQLAERTLGPCHKEVTVERHRPMLANPPPRHGLGPAVVVAPRACSGSIRTCR